MAKHWIVTAVDHGETCDGKARVLEVCKTKEEANAFVRSDIEKWADDHATEDIYVDFDAMAAGYNHNADEGCEWNIEEVELPIPSAECIKKAEQVLVDNGIEEDEADTVLQAIGYTLLNVELYPDSDK